MLDRGRFRVVRPGGLELPTFWFVVCHSKIQSGFFGVAYELEKPSKPSSIVRMSVTGNLVRKNGQELPIPYRSQLQLSGASNV